MPNSIRSEEDFEYPPFDPRIFDEIVRQLPDSHLRNYWAAWASILKVPADDPVLVAVVMMSTVAILGRRECDEMMTILQQVKILTGEESDMRSFQIRLEGLADTCKETKRHIIDCRQTIQSATRSMELFRTNLNEPIVAAVKKLLPPKTYFERHPLAIAWVAGVASAAGVVVGFFLAHLGSH